MKNERLLDLIGVICPMNFVKAKLFLEQFERGEVVEIILDEGDPLTNVTRSLKDEGHQVVKVDSFDETSYKIRVKKG